MIGSFSLKILREDLVKLLVTRDGNESEIIESEILGMKNFLVNFNGKLLVSFLKAFGELSESYRYR